MNEDLEIHSLVYPPSPTSFPTVWRSYLHDMIPPRFAVWYPDKTDYQIFDVQRMANHSIIVKPTRTDRENSFYFTIQNGGDRYSRTITIYKPRASKHTHSDTAIWFTGSWLCRRTSGRLQATIPIMGVSEHSLFPFRGNVGIYRNRIFQNWCDDFTHGYVREMIHNRKIYTSLQQFEEPEIPSTSEIPKFVAIALVKDAIEKKDACPITMETITMENSAVTSCFHVFEKNSIREWLQDKTCCPVCKQKCVLTVV